MGDQEMQFADPAWRPPSPGGVNADTQQQEPYVPRPVNNTTFEQAQQQDEPYANNASYSEGYQAQPLGGIPSISSTPLRTKQRRGRSLWPWIVAALIIFALASGAFNRSGYGNGSFPKMDMPKFSHSQPFANTQYFSAGLHPTIEITDLTGSITVHSGSRDNIAVQTDQPGTKPVDSPGPNDTHNITVNSTDPSAEVNLDVTVANGADLVLKTGSGDITVDGVNGQMNLTSDSGGINLSQVSLSGNSTLNTNSGDINFEGAIDPNGAYRFQSQSGSVDVTLPSDASFHADITTGSGSINSEFPELNPPSSDATSAHGDVGSPPRANVTIKTIDGSIDLHR
jgi:hypothetical protein